MSGSVYGNIYKISTWGESHGKAIGVVIDGCPSGVPLCEDDFSLDMSRRKPGKSPYSTKRTEDDNVEILSGVFEGKTTGTPISLIIYNKDYRSKDYSQIANVYRPGHADYVFDKKYGIRDYRGGGRSSGRETAARVAAGVIAKKILGMLGISINAHILSIKGENVNRDLSNLKDIVADICDDSVGGIIECVVTGVFAGLGEPVFDKLDAVLAKALFSIGSVKGVEVGAGFDVAKMKGSENNDQMYSESGHINKYTNNAGGILGGISDGSDIIIRCAIKPTPSISKDQKTVNGSGENCSIKTGGRHDIIIVPRAVVVVEAMTALTLVDYLFMGMTSRIDNIIAFFGKKSD